jgi:hypothetical protein
MACYIIASIKESIDEQNKKKLILFETIPEQKLNNKETEVLTDSELLKFLSFWPTKNSDTYYNEIPGFHKYGEDLLLLVSSKPEVISKTSFSNEFLPITPDYCPLGISYTVFEN